MTPSPSRRLLTGLLASTISLAGCAHVPPMGAAPQIRSPNSFAASQTLASGPAEGWPQDAWWRAYDDPQLDALIAEGLANAPDVAVAIARLRAAEGYRQQATGALLPALNAQGSVGGSKQSYNYGIPADFVPKGIDSTGSVALSLNFDIDLWGKNRAALHASNADELAARLDVAQARLMLSTDIAAAYADLAQLYADRDIEVAAIDLRRHTQALVASRYASGLDTSGEVKQAEANVPAARATLAATDESIALTRNRLAALIGAGPDRGLAIARPSAVTRPRLLPADVTTNLIGQRPDIAAARARVEAAAQRIKVARADFYPALSLSALAGFESLGLADLLKGGSSYGNAGPAISLPIFHGGQISGHYRTARAGYDEAVANYDRIVAGAYHDVADAVTSRNMRTRRLAEAQEALAASQAACRIARERYAGGLSTYLTVLSAEDAVLQNRRIVAELTARAFTLDVALVRALGGGFTTPTAPHA